MYTLVMQQSHYHYLILHTEMMSGNIFSKKYSTSVKVTLTLSYMQGIQASDSDSEWTDLQILITPESEITIHMGRYCNGEET